MRSPLASVTRRTLRFSPRPPPSACTTSPPDRASTTRTTSTPARLEILYRGITLGVRGEHHRTLTGPDGPEVDETADGRREQHAGLVVACEHVRALDQPGRGHERPRADLDQPLEHGRPPLRLALHDGEPVVVIASGHDAVRDDLEVLVRPDCLLQFGERGEFAPTAVAQVAAEAVLLLDEEHPRPGLGGGDRGRHPGWSATGHADVDVGIALVETVGGRVAGHPSAGGEAAEHLLVGRPQPLRPDERLVVEAGAQEPSDELVGCLHVVLQRRPRVLRSHDHPGRQTAVGAANIGLVADLHRAAGIVERRASAGHAAGGT